MKLSVSPGRRYQNSRFGISLPVWKMQEDCPPFPFDFKHEWARRAGVMAAGFSKEVTYKKAPMPRIAGATIKPYPMKATM